MKQEIEDQHAIDSFELARIKEEWKKYDRPFLSDGVQAKIRRAFTHTARGRTRRDMPAADRIKEFIADLDFLCVMKKAHDEQGQRCDLAERRKDVLKRCRLALDDLKKIERGKLILVHEPTIGRLGLNDPNPHVDHFMWLMLDAAGAVPPLQKFITTLESYQKVDEAQKRTGRPPADDDEFVRRVAEIYTEHIGRRPTTTKDGPFVSVIQAVLDVEYPERAIKEALN